MRLLVVEDDLAAQAMLAHVIKGFGYEVTLCSDGETALESYRALRHELLVVDWMLPGMDGLELCRRVRACKDGDQSVILVITSHRQSMTLHSVLEAGADDYLPKPIDVAPLSVRLAIARERYDGRVREKEAEKARRILEEQAQQHQKIESLALLTGGIAHDFNNILAVILGYTHLAMDEASPDSPTQMALAQVVEAADRAQRLVQEILAFSRQTDIPRAPRSLATLLSEALDKLRIPPTIQVRREIAEENATILANEVHMRRAIINLCTNAVEAMREAGGTLTIALEAIHIPGPESSQTPRMKTGEYLHVRVSDTGPGIEQAIQDRIFEPFFTTKEIGKGSGMGLAVVHGVMSSHGGQVVAESVPGRGATFHLYLPRCEEPEGAAPVEQKAEPAEVKGGEHILLVDDEVLLTNLGKVALERRGYRVTAMTDSRAALDTFRADPRAFDIVVTDQTMPDLKGDALAAEILHIRPEVPVLITTGFSDQIAEERARNLGVRQVLNKPVSTAEMVHAIRASLDESM